MTSGWDVYYAVFLAALLALLFPGILGAISRFAGARRRSGSASQEPAAPFSSELTGSREVSTDLPSLGRRVNTRFFLGANAALTLLTLAFILVPCIGALSEREHEDTGIAAASGILFVAILAAVALLYASRKGDLDWLRSYRTRDDEGR